MLTLQHLFWLFLLAIACAWWWQARELKEQALHAVKRHCKALNLQLLDDSLVLFRLHPERHPRRGWYLARHYHFEFTSTGDERYTGEITLCGHQIGPIELDPHRI